jgi:hypothetical protein
MTQKTALRQQAQMKRIALGYIPLIVILCATSGKLHASSMLMGRMTTVGPYGAQDAARNPALLSSHEKNNTLGLSANYQRIPHADIDLKQFQPIRTASEYDPYNAGSARVSYARVIDRFTLGFDCFFNMQESNLRQNVWAYNGNFVFGQGASKEKIMSTLFTFALSAALDSSHSIGIRLNCSYINSRKRNTSRFLMASLPPVYVYSLDMTAFEEISTLPCLGYFGKIGVSEIGLMMTSGRFSWKKMGKEGLTYNMSTVMAQLQFKAKGDLPLWFTYNMGPAVLAGFQARPSYDFCLGLELEVSIPVAYRDPFLISGEKMTNPIARLQYFSSRMFGLKNRVLIKPSVSIRGGGEITISRTTVFNLGAGFGYNASPSTATGLNPAPHETFFSDYSLTSVLGTAGFDFLVGKNSTITLGSCVTYYTYKEKQALRKSLSLLASEVKAKIVTLDIIAAASVGF